MLVRFQLVWKKVLLKTTVQTRSTSVWPVLVEGGEVGVCVTDWVLTVVRLGCWVSIVVLWERLAPVLGVTGSVSETCRIAIWAERLAELVIGKKHLHQRQKNNPVA